MNSPRPLPGFEDAAHAAELLEDEALLVARDPGAAIADLHEHVTVRARRPPRRPRAPASEYFTALSIRFDRTWRRRTRSPRTVGSGRFTVARTGTSSCPTDAVATASSDERADVDVVEHVRERAGLDPRRVEHVLDQRRQPARLVRDQREKRRAVLGRELAPALLERLRGSDHRRHRAAQLVRHERDEVRAHRREAPQLGDGPMLRVVGADVLDGRGGEASDQRHELDLLGREGIGLGAGEGDQPERGRADEQRRRQPRAQPEVDQHVLLRVAPIGHVRAVHRPSRRARSRRSIPPTGPELPAGKTSPTPLPADGEHLEPLALEQHDGDPVERHDTSNLADERRERLVELERRRRARGRNGSPTRGCPRAGRARHVTLPPRRRVPPTRADCPASRTTSQPTITPTITWPPS